MSGPPPRRRRELASGSGSETQGISVISLCRHGCVRVQTAELHSTFECSRAASELTSGNSLGLIITFNRSPRTLASSARRRSGCIARLRAVSSNSSLSAARQFALSCRAVPFADRCGAHVSSCGACVLHLPALLCLPWLLRCNGGWCSLLAAQNQMLFVSPSCPNASSCRQCQRQ
jgi:hypothetical protein